MSDKKNLLSESQIRQFMKLASLTPLASGFVGGLTERTADEIEESHGRRPKEGAGGPPDQNSRNEGMGMDYRDDDLEATERELGDMDDDVHDKDEEIDDLEADLDAEAPAADAGEGRMISVDDFLSALESALEGVMGDEVEIDSDEMADDEEVEVADVDMADDGMDMDVEVEDDMLEEKKKEGYDARLADAEGAKHGKKSQSSKDREHEAEAAEEEHGDKKFSGDSEMDKDDKKKNESTEANDDLVEAVTKRVAARILKSALAKK
jgi:hypothetical protein